MKAVILSGANKPVHIEDIPTPTPAANEILIKLAYSAFNYRDVWIRTGNYNSAVKDRIVLGSDGFGTIAALGHDVTGWEIGQPVIINPSHNWGDNPAAFDPSFKILGSPDQGTFAEYIAVGQQYVHAKPDGYTDEEAAALPLAGITTYRAVTTRAQVRKGEKVLITGIGAGTALLALHFALVAGAEVYVTSSSPEKIAKAQTLGAKDGFNYRNADWVDKATASSGGFDVILDSASGDGFASLLQLAKPGGRIVFWGATSGIINNIRPADIFYKNLSVLGTTMGTPQEFKDMLQLIKDHPSIKPIVDKVYPSLDHAEEALQYMKAGQQFGKIVLTNQ
ncbi:zinc-binding dehydrogenase [Chitinophaga pendula]|uniref:quinone oxidoreductase family protein n=1 Tax=Chitinophaga TaxID=79328 RepID=UPI000BAFB472|nr:MULTISPECIES: zinc-binding dehydrogenase [Chitinophaga]ASZ12873.1 alcohol dehydrogenase [Chitinophaga sp. MD30]UCJ09495.1 zinc-binding dehydrogenase [Chitinophaga pendula]